MYFYLYVSIGVQYSYTTEKRWWDGHEQEMTVEGGVMAGVGTKDKCKMLAKRGVVAGVEPAMEWETTAKGWIMVEVGAGEHQQASQDSKESAQV